MKTPILGASLILLFAACSASAQSGKDVFLTVSVANQHGQVVTGLEKEQFSISENKSSYEITSFSDKDQPVSMVILVDMSLSMAKTLPMVANWLTHLTQAANPSNEYLVVGFDVQSQVLCNWGCEQKQLVSVFDSISRTKVKKETALYDACVFSLAELGARKSAKRVIVLLSDGIDTSSKTPLRGLRRSLDTSDVMIYAIGFLGNDDIGSALGMEGQGVMDTLASITGGQSFFPMNRDAFDKTSQHIVFELQHQYVLGFKMDAKPDREMRTIKVKITPASGSTDTAKHLIVRYRAGVYVP